MSSQSLSAVARKFAELMSEDPVRGQSVTRSGVTLNRSVNELTRLVAGVDLVAQQGELLVERPVQLREFAKNYYNW